jgi:hypothetical protein
MTKVITSDYSRVPNCETLQIISEGTDVSVVQAYQKSELFLVHHVLWVNILEIHLELSALTGLCVCKY